MLKDDTISRKETRTVAWLQLSVGVFSLILGAVTWRMWWLDGEYPAVPWFSLFSSVPDNVDRGLAVAALLSNAMLTMGAIRFLVSQKTEDYVASRGLMLANVMCLMSLTGSVLLDQHRLQVWVWEFFWLILFLSLAIPRVALRCCRVFVVSIYVYSAVSKIDAGFTEVQGPWLWQGLRRAVGLSEATWGVTANRSLLVFPLGEFLVAVLLLLGPTRRMGVILSLIMHLTLLLILGPLGWNQQPGVLLWNIFFLISIPLLFWDMQSLGFGGAELWHSIRSSLASQGSPRSVAVQRGNAFCVMATGFLCLWPALEGIGVCDHWPAWAVYSSRPEIVTMAIPLEQVERLPVSLQPHVGQPLPFSNLCPVSLDQWSFQERNCPVYPQARYRVALASHLKREYGLTVSGQVQSTPDRWTGMRMQRAIDLHDEEEESRYFFGTRSRMIHERANGTAGHWAIALTAQLAVAGYAIGRLLTSWNSPNRSKTQWVALFWSFGLLAMISHVCCAFHFLHHWSHTAALKHTASRTAEVTGWNWPGGLYINYAFVGLWTVEVLRMWCEVLGKRGVASHSWSRFINVVFLFMMFNATVVFGPWHWTIIAIALTVGWVILRRPFNADDLSAHHPDSK